MYRKTVFIFKDSFHTIMLLWVIAKTTNFLSNRFVAESLICSIFLSMGFCSGIIARLHAGLDMLLILVFHRSRYAGEMPLENILLCDLEDITLLGTLSMCLFPHL